MARNGIFRRGQAWAEALRDPVPMIDQCVAILALALFLAFLGGVTLAAESGTAERRPTCTPDLSKCCDEFVPDADCITISFRQDARELSPKSRAVTVVPDDGHHAAKVVMVSTLFLFAFIFVLQALAP